MGRSEAPEDKLQVRQQTDGSRRRGSKLPFPRRAAGKRRHSLRMRVTGWTAVVLTGVLVVGSLAAYAKYRSIWDSIAKIDVFQDLNNRPPQYGNALNILLIGSDTRSGGNGKIGGHDQGARSDTVMVVHISPGRKGAVVLSLPRDSVVPVLQCAPEAGTPGQTAEPGQIEQLNSTFGFGGPGCLWKTIEATTHIRINDFVELTFVGFEKVINRIGGVTVCLPEAVHDPKSRLHLSRGRHHIFGSQALAFWREREAVGLGSDLQRIQRDQFLMASLLQGIEKSGLLGSPSKMLAVIDATAKAKALAMDSGMTISQVVRIAASMKGVGPGSVQFIEAPTVTYPANPNWVEWPSTDDALFSAIAHNSTLPKKIKPAPGQTPKHKPVLASVSPDKVKVEVLNGTNTSGLAGDTATDLTSRSYDVLGSSNATTQDYTSSVIEYSSRAERAAAMTLKSAIPHVTLQRDPSVEAGTVNLILGSSFTGLNVQNGNSKQTSVNGLTRQFGGIKGNARICKDQHAFSS
ncbi:MAG TPA: LCP family protein [Streptosporangiaceae bacterium]|jgi:LCP family protein required for cell wall assembly